LTIAQFAVLAYLYPAKRERRGAVPLGALADFVGAPPSTFARVVRPLTAAGLVVEATGPARRRRRDLRITAAGAARLRAAMPLWAGAQAQLAGILGEERASALNGLFDLATVRARDLGRGILALPSAQRLGRARPGDDAPRVAAGRRAHKDVI